MELNISVNGPCTPNFKKPVVGEPPASHALSHMVVITLVTVSRQVENPKPQTLSANAQRKSKPILNLKIPKIALNLFDSIPLEAGRGQQTPPDYIRNNFDSEFLVNFTLLKP